MKKFSALISIMLTAVLLLSACGTAEVKKADKPADAPAAESANKETEKSEKPEEKKGPEVYKIGDSVDFDDLTITVNGIKESKGGKIIKPADGEVFVLVDVTVENKGDKEANISSMLQTSLVDSDGFKHNITIVEGMKGTLDGSVGAGRKLRAEVAFSVSKDAKGLEFIFSDPFKNGEAIWKVK